MKRWLLLFLGFLLPIQFAWSAAAVYCQHETAPASFHFGHHVHKHAVAKPADLKAATSADTADSAPGMLHADCGYCHANVAQLPLLPTNLFAPAQSPGLEHPPRDLYSYRIEPDIDRPKWMRAS